MFKSVALGVLVLMLAACGAPRPRHAGPQTPDESAWPENLRIPGRIYRVDAGQSELRVLVYRAGPLAHFGHNHVVVNRALRGEVKIADAASGFWLSVPAAAFVVDDASARREEGSGFDTEVPDDAKAGTLQNMLGAAVLNAAEFPAITVNGVAMSSRQDAPPLGTMTVTVVIKIAGHESIISVPFALQSDSGRIAATGSMELRQTELGLVPYSLMLGALHVQDAMTVKFKIIAAPR